MHIRIRRVESSEAASKIRCMYDKVALYPLIVGGCWILYFINDGVSTMANYEFSNTFSFVSTITGALNGLLAAIYFFWKSDESRSRWRRALAMPLLDGDINAQVLISEIPIDFQPDEEYDEASMRMSMSLTENASAGPPEDANARSPEDDSGLSLPAILRISSIGVPPEHLI